MHAPPNVLLSLCIIYDVPFLCISLPVISLPIFCPEVFGPSYPCTMDLDDKAEHIRDILGSHAPDDQRRILHDLLAAVPMRSTPSVVSEEDYVRIFRNLLFSALFPHVGVPQPPWNLGITTRPLA